MGLSAASFSSDQRLAVLASVSSPACIMKHEADPVERVRQIAACLGRGTRGGGQRLLVGSRFAGRRGQCVGLVWARTRQELRPVARHNAARPRRRVAARRSGQQRLRPPACCHRPRPSARSLPVVGRPRSGSADVHRSPPGVGNPGSAASVSASGQYGRDAPSSASSLIPTLPVRSASSKFDARAPPARPVRSPPSKRRQPAGELEPTS